jgi:hypothetical protein
MKNLTSTFLALVSLVCSTYLHGCYQPDYDGPYDYCTNDYTRIIVTFKDPVTKEPIEGQRFLFGRFNNSSFVPSPFFDTTPPPDTFTTDAEGQINYKYYHEEGKYYQLRHLSNADYDVAGHWNIPNGCDHNISPPIFCTQ